jgi:two-component system, OmpR family, KDP operon response regulator KdpE
MASGVAQQITADATVAQSSPHRVLVVDDEPHLVRAVRMYLELQGYTVFGADSGEAALDAVRETLPDLVVLDVMMPGMDGFETLQDLRRYSQVPVIMLTARGDENEKVRGLALGADDYVTKPFSQRELLARVQAVLRRAEQPAVIPKTRIEVDDDLSLDFDRAEVYVRGEPVRLTATEYRLLYHLASNPGRLMPSETLLAKVWGYEYREEDHYVRLYVSYLRQKIEPDPSHPKYILTVPGLGYKFVDYRQQARPQVTASGTRSGR